NTMDLSIVPAVQSLSHLPIIVDPSHGTGRRDKVIPLARASVAVVADGVMVEVHTHPERALSDGPQALIPEMFKQMMTELRAIHRVIGEARLSEQEGFTCEQKPRRASRLTAARELLRPGE